MSQVWRKCSTCKKDILLNGVYYVCSISTCRTHATNYAFCSVPCWDAHVPVERHREDSAAAIEKRAPRVVESDSSTQAQAPSGKRVIAPTQTSVDDETLVVVSKVRKYISEKSGLNCSASVYEALTARIQRLCDRAIEEARRQGRKTVMDRDVP